ncbi:MAG TPA: hypothetical protein VFR93_02720, partial [Candidatus Limnocylindrales bacterium]|nr:hypothetical protein [Candidatus Limnocylindrales bacterium]
MPQLADDHAVHDRLLISAYVAGDLQGPELAQAEALVIDCPDCGRLAADLRAVAAAMPSAAVPVRPRDFRLTSQQANARRGWGGRWSLDRLRSALRPAGAALATFGIAGLLVAGLSGLGSGAAILSNVGTAVGVPVAGQDSNYGAGGATSGGVTQPAASAGSGAGAPGAGASGPGGSKVNGPEYPTTPAPADAGKAVGGPAVSPSGDREELTGTPARGSPSGPSPLVVGSVALLAAG